MRLYMLGANVNAETVPFIDMLCDMSRSCRGMVSNDQHMLS